MRKVYDIAGRLQSYLFSFIFTVVKTTQRYIWLVYCGCNHSFLPLMSRPSLSYVTPPRLPKLLQVIIQFTRREGTCTSHSVKHLMGIPVWVGDNKLQTSQLVRTWHTISSNCSTDNWLWLHLLLTSSTPLGFKWPLLPLLSSGLLCDWLVGCNYLQVCECTRLLL